MRSANVTWPVRRSRYPISLAAQNTIAALFMHLRHALRLGPDSLLTGPQLLVHHVTVTWPLGRLRCVGLLGLFQTRVTPLVGMVVQYSA